MATITETERFRDPALELVRLEKDLHKLVPWIKKIWNNIKISRKRVHIK